jgi:phosphonate transport system substrate-binding protein
LARVKQALLDFDPTGGDAEGLYHWERSQMPGGFIEAQDGDYAELREWSARFGLFGEPGREEQ